MIIVKSSPIISPETQPILYAEARRLVGISGSQTERLHQNSLQQSCEQACFDELGLVRGFDAESGEGTVIQWSRFLPGYRTGIYREIRPTEPVYPEAHGPSIFIPLDGCANLEFKTYSLNELGRTAWNNIKTRTSREALQITTLSQCTLTDQQLLTQPLVIDTTQEFLEITNRGHEHARFIQVHSGSARLLL